MLADNVYRWTWAAGGRASARADGEDALHSPRSQGPEGPGGTVQELTGLSCLPTATKLPKTPRPLASLPLGQGAPEA